MRQFRRSHIRPTKGFTATELLVSIAVIAILIAIALPSLTHIRESAKEHRSLANMRTHTGILQSYTLDNADYFPFITDPNADYTIIRAAGESVQTVFFGANQYWFLALADQYYGSILDPELFAYPTQAGGIYLYSSALFTSHRLWNTTTRVSSSSSQWRPVKSSLVRYPSSKAAFTETRTRDDASYFPIWSNQGMVFRGDGFGFGFIDGSSRRFADADLLLPYQGGDGGGPQSWLGEVGVVGVHTVDGFLGRDLQ